MKSLIKLLEWAKAYKMTEREREAQRRSFAFGNANIDNPDVTRELVDQVAEEMKNERPDN